MTRKKEIYTDAVKKIGKLVIKTSAKFIPNHGGIISDALNFAFDVGEAIIDVQKKLNQDKFEKYIMGLEEYDGDIVITDENFSHITRQLIKDDELSKTEFYSKLTISIANSEMSEDERALYINTLGSLTRYEVEFARNFFIYSNFDICEHRDRREQILKLTSGNDGLLLKTLSKLISCGLIYNIRIPGMSGDSGSDYNKTKQLDILISFIYSNLFLNPEAIHKKRKENYDILYVKSRDVNDHFDKDNRLSDKEKKEIIDEYYKCIVGTFTGKKVGIVDSSHYYNNKFDFKVKLIGIIYSISIKHSTFRKNELHSESTIFNIHSTDGSYLNNDDQRYQKIVKDIIDKLETIED